MLGDWLKDARVRVIIVYGPAGYGKTHLVDYAHMRASRAFARVSCAQGPGGVEPVGDLIAEIDRQLNCRASSLGQIADGQTRSALADICSGRADTSIIISNFELVLHYAQLVPKYPYYDLFEFCRTTIGIPRLIIETTQPWPDDLQRVNVSYLDIKTGLTPEDWLALAASEADQGFKGHLQTIGTACQWSPRALMFMRPGGVRPTSLVIPEGAPAEQVLHLLAMDWLDRMPAAWRVVLMCLALAETECTPAMVLRVVKVLLTAATLTLPNEVSDEARRLAGSRPEGDDAPDSELEDPLQAVQRLLVALVPGNHVERHMERGTFKASDATALYARKALTDCIEWQGSKDTIWSDFRLNALEAMLLGYGKDTRLVVSPVAGEYLVEHPAYQRVTVTYLHYLSRLPKLSAVKNPLVRLCYVFLRAWWYWDEVCEWKYIDTLIDEMRLAVIDTDGTTAGSQSLMRRLTESLITFRTHSPRALWTERPKPDACRKALEAIRTTEQLLLCERTTDTEERWFVSACIKYGQAQCCSFQDESCPDFDLSDQLYQEATQDLLSVQEWAWTNSFILLQRSRHARERSQFDTARNLATQAFDDAGEEGHDVRALASMAQADVLLDELRSRRTTLTELPCVGDEPDPSVSVIAKTIATQWVKASVWVYSIQGLYPIDSYAVDMYANIHARIMIGISYLSAIGSAYARSACEHLHSEWEPYWFHTGHETAVWEDNLLEAHAAVRLRAYIAPPVPALGDERYAKQRGDVMIRRSALENSNQLMTVIGQYAHSMELTSLAERLRKGDLQ